MISVKIEIIPVMITKAESMLNSSLYDEKKAQCLKHSTCSINISFHDYNEFLGYTRKVNPEHQGLEYPIKGSGLYIVKKEEIHGEILIGFVIRTLFKLI